MNLYLFIRSFTPKNKKLFVFNRILFVFLILEARYENFENSLQQSINLRREYRDSVSAVQYIISQ